MITVRVLAILYANDDQAADEVLAVLRTAETLDCAVVVIEQSRELDQT